MPDTAFLKKWSFWATHSRLPAMVEAAKAKARDYRSTRDLKAIIHLVAGKLPLQLPM